MNKLYILYVSQSDRLSVRSTIPILDFNVVNNYPLLYIGSTKSESLNTIIYDKRGSYVKCGDHKRFYRGFMELFKYHEMNPSISTLGVHLLESGISDESLSDRMRHWLFVYRMVYGSNLVISDIKTELSTMLCMDIVCKREVYGPSIPKADRQVLSRKKYEDQHRDRLNAKSKRYYESHKEILKAKRAAKNVIPAVVDNTAEYQLSCHGC
jgi:hypothetical protein